MDGLRREMQHGVTDWAYVHCTSGPGGTKCDACVTGRQARRGVKVRPPKPVPPRILRLREQVACMGCGAVREPCQASKLGAQTRIAHKPGCPVADIPEGDEEECAA